MLPPPVRHSLKLDYFSDVYRTGFFDIGGRAQRNEIYQELIKGGITEVKLEAVLGVSVEMLCYAGNYCNRESHARELGDGSAEFATLVWLLRAALFKA